MERKRRLRLISAVVSVTVLAVIITAITINAVSCSYTHNRLYFKDCYGNTEFDLKLNLNSQRQAGTVYYFGCDYGLSDLEQMIAEQMPETQMQRYGQNILVKYKNSYFYISDKGENSFTLSNMSAVYYYEGQASFGFLLPYHLTEISELPSSFSYGDDVTTSYGYDEWKRFYAYSDCLEPCVFNDTEKYIDVPLTKQNNGIAEGKMIRLSFTAEGTVHID